MKRYLHSALRALAVWLCAGMALAVGQAAEPADKPADKTLTMVVMDPLAAPLSCPCVEGYAQRKYEALAAQLEAKLNRKVTLLFVEALSRVKADDLPSGNIDLIIGKKSVVEADAKQASLSLTPVARLTDKFGSTTQHGLIVVPKADPAQSVADLAGYQIIFGPADCQEKHAAAIELLTAAGIELPKELATDQSCSGSAGKILSLGKGEKGAAVISSYAAPLLEGCGTIKKGDLRVVGKTGPVPFITAFATGALSAEDRKQVQQTLLTIAEKPELCQALESLIGFVPAASDKPGSKKK